MLNKSYLLCYNLVKTEKRCSVYYFSVQTFQSTNSFKAKHQIFQSNQLNRKPTTGKGATDQLFDVKFYGWTTFRY